MPAPYPREFRQDVVSIARKGQMPIAQVAKDFGITASCLRRWLAQDDVEAGIRPGVTKAENEELKILRTRVLLVATLGIMLPSARTSCYSLACAQW